MAEYADYGIKVPLPVTVTCEAFNDRDHLPQKWYLLLVLTWHGAAATPRYMFWPNYSDQTAGWSPQCHPNWWFQEGNSTKMHLNSGLGGTVTCPDLDLFTCSNDMYCLVLPFRKQQVLLETPGKLFTWMTESSQCISFGLFVKPYWSILILDHACHPPYTIDIRLHVISQPPITDAKFYACQGSRTMF